MRVMLVSSCMKHLRRFSLVVASLLAVSLTLTACQPSPPAYQTLMQQLKDKGMDVSPTAEPVTVPFFTPEGWEITVDKTKMIDVYEFTNGVSTRTEANNIASDGTPSFPPNWHWHEAPHLWMADNVIIIYDGADSHLREALTQIYGAQFAGSL